MAVEWLIGVSINIVGAATTNLGTVLMKYHSAKKNNEGVWNKVGLGLFALGSILTFVSFSFAAQSLLAGISAIQFVTNLFFAHYLLGEDYTKYNFLGTLVLISAITLLVVSSDKSNVTSDVDMFFNQYYFTFSHLFFVSGMLLGVLLLALGFWFRVGVVPFWLRGPTSERRLLLELSLPRSKSPATKILAPCAYVCLSAIIGAQSVVSGKVLSLVIARSITVGNFYELKRPRAYIALGVWLGCAVFWVIHLSRAMRIFPGAFVIPLTQVCWTLWTMVSGGVVYGEFTDISAYRVVLFVLGALALFGGVALLAPVYGANKNDASAPISRQHSGISSSNTKLQKLMTCLSVDELAVASNENTVVSPRFRNSQSIVFQESLDLAIADPPYIRFRRWRRNRARTSPSYIPSSQGGARSSKTEMSRSRKTSTTQANTPPAVSSEILADTLGNCRV